MKTKRYSLAALALTLLALAACRQDDGLGTDNGNAEPLPVTIGQIAIDGGATRLATANPDAWETGDLIRVSAPGPDATTLTATYRYTAADADATNPAARWTQVDPARTDDPDAAHATGDTYPLYLESLAATGTDAPATTLETWGGSAGWTGSTDYLDQSTPGAYRLNDYLLCPAATRALAHNGAQRTCQLSGTLSHQRVSLVLKVADGGTYSHRLPQDAVLRLHLTDGTTTATQGRQLTAWRQGKTDASGTPGTSGYVPATTTFRALVALEDVPGITATATVRPGSVLGEVTYTDGGSRQTQRITYSVKSATAGSTDADGNALIAAGTRITVTATFRDIPYTPDPDPTPDPTPDPDPTPSNVTIQGSATLAPWQDTDLGEVGTEEVTDIEPVTEGEKTIYQIYTAEGLKEFADMVNGTEAYATARSNGKTKDPAANARLMADIDLSSVCGASVGGEPGTSWAPMGSTDSNDNPYTGTFDGQGHTVRGLYISSASYRCAGLFGAIGTNGKVEHLRVEATEVKNTYNTSSNAGGTGVLAGYNSGTITACHAKGNVSSSGNNSYIGGLVGYNNSGTITDCHATGSVSSSGNDSYIGGLVGYNGGTITDCHATGNVSGSGNDSYIGGLVGYNVSSTITDYYAMGNVSGSGNISGLMGYSSSSTITACYATGSVSGSGNIGGLVGNNSTNTITACYATGSVSGSGNNSNIGGLVGNNNSTSPITDCFWQKGADGTPTAGIGGSYGSGGNITLTEITGTEPNTWENAVGKYEAAGGQSRTSTLNASIYDWNSSYGTSSDLHCGYCFVKNPAYKSAADTPGVAPLLLTPIEE